MAETAFQRRVRELQEAKGKQPEPEPVIEHDPDLIPEDPYAGSKPLVELKDHIDILEAYEKYGSPLRDGFQPQMRPNQREGIKVRCPVPGHLDKRPDAWINLDKNVINCGPCGDLGLDLFELAAIFYDYPRPGYKTDKEAFKRLAAQVAEDFGILIRPGLGGPKITRAVEVPSGSPGLEESVQPEAEKPKTAGQPGDLVSPGSSLGGDQPTDLPSATVIEFPPPDESLVEEPSIWPTIDFDALHIWGTFLGDWIRYAQEIDQTPEYFFATGGVSLGFAVGRDAYLADGSGVRPNMMICIIAPSGIGKSRAIEQFQMLLDEALPDDDPSIHGVTQFVVPGSGETIIDYFAPKKDSGDPIAVRGLLEFNEFSDMTSRAKRNGSTYEPILMRFYDQSRPIGRGTVGMRVKAVDHHLGVVTTTQPRLIRQYLSREQVDSGFVGRWLFACGEPRVLPARLSIAHPPPRCINQLKEIYRFYEGRKLALEYTPEAERLWTQFYQDTIAPIKVDISTSSIFSRIDLHSKKLMSHFAYNEMAERLEEHHVQSLITLYPYLHRTFEFVQGNIGVSAVDDCAEDVEKYIERRVDSKKPNPTPNDVRKALRNRHDLELIKHTLEVMLKLEMIEQRPDPKPKNAAGPVTERIYLTA